MRPGLLAALPSVARPAQVALVLGAGGSARAVGLRAARGRRGARRGLEPHRRSAPARWPPTSGSRPSIGRSPRTCLVNCTSVGLTDGEFKALPVAADSLGNYATVADLVYRAGGTGLVAEARRRGCAVVDGLEILVRQGALSFEAWTGREAPVDVMRDAARGSSPDEHDPGTSHSSDGRAAPGRRAAP